MKKLMFLVAASLFVFAACSNEDDPSSEVNPENSGITFELSAVNGLTDGIGTRMPVYSQEATQHVTRVSVYAFVQNGSTYLHQKTYDITGWTDGTTFKRFAVPDADKLPVGVYKFLAVGRDASDRFSVTTPTSGNTNYTDMLATIVNSGDESEIFAGSADAEVMAQGGTRVSIEMTRKVAGVLGYFKNVPQVLNGTTVKYLRLKVSNSNQQVNLTNGVGINTAATPYNIIDMDLSGQAVSNGVYVGNDLSGQGVVKVPNSQLGGSFYMPVSGVSMTLGLYDASGTAIKEWTVSDTNSSGATQFNLLANHFYALGVKGATGSVDGGTPGNPGDDDAPVDLLTDQNIVITISPAWELIHNLVIQ